MRLLYTENIIPTDFVRNTYKLYDLFINTPGRVHNKV